MYVWGGSHVFVEDGALGNEANVLARELLLQLADEARLDLLETLVLAVGHEDDHGLAAATVDLLDGGDDKVAELGGEVLARVLELDEGARDALLEVVELLAARLEDLLLVEACV